MSDFDQQNLERNIFQRFVGNFSPSPTSFIQPPYIRRWSQISAKHIAKLPVLQYAYVPDSYDEIVFYVDEDSVASFKNALRGLKPNLNFVADSSLNIQGIKTFRVPGLFYQFPNHDFDFSSDCHELLVESGLCDCETPLSIALSSPFARDIFGLERCERRMLTVEGNFDFTITNYDNDRGERYVGFYDNHSGIWNENVNLPFEIVCRKTLSVFCLEPGPNDIRESCSAVLGFGRKNDSLRIAPDACVTYDIYKDSLNNPQRVNLDREEYVHNDTISIGIQGDLIRPGDSLKIHVGNDVICIPLSTARQPLVIGLDAMEQMLEIGFYKISSSIEVSEGNSQFIISFKKNGSNKYDDVKKLVIQCFSNLQIQFVP